MKVVPYAERYKQDFIDLNQGLIETLFEMEPEDYITLEHIGALVEQGAQVFFAVNEEDTVLACCMVAPKGNDEWEIEKFAARNLGTGTGAGTGCLKACMEYAWEQGAKRLLIVSNTKCERAVALYRKYGFQEIPVGSLEIPYQRVDIVFEMTRESFDEIKQNG